VTWEPGGATAGQLRHLQELTAELGDAVTVDDVARATLDVACRVDEVVRVGLAVSHGAGRELQFVSSDQDPVSDVGVRWCTIDGLAHVPVGHTVRTGNNVFLPTLSELARDFPELLDRQRSFGTQSMVSLALPDGATCLGSLLLAFGVEQRFSGEQTAFLSAFAAQVGQALRRALAYQVQRTTSEQLQRSLMPHSLPELERLSLGAHYQSGGANIEVGGDWYDVLPLADGSVVVSLGDVMGRGVGAAVVMGEVRAALRAYAVLDAQPGVVLARLDELVSGSMPDQIVTVAYGLVSADRATVTLAVAGHPPPLLVPRSGSATVLDRAGPALGVGVPHSHWPQTRVKMADYDTVVFYSDGLVERRDLDLFVGLDQVREHIERMDPRRRHPRELCAALAERMCAVPVDDDVTVLAVMVPPPGRERTVTHQLPADATAARLARRLLGGQLAEWGVDEELIEVAQLCTSELVTNVVIHSGTTSALTVRMDEEYLQVLVQDEGSTGMVRRPGDLDETSISGRGLSLVEALTSAWRAEHNADGTTVWFELPLVRDRSDEALAYG
jgi:serine phosphatase RsbU (regulator of sigma subunit)/anti-sigma regulatory factor (Ser/Thr protein kinase)